jgi:hypothetical protein
LRDAGAEAGSAIAALVGMAEAHRAAIVTGNTPGGRRSALDPQREAEVQVIKEAIAAGRVQLGVAGVAAV